MPLLKKTGLKRSRSIAEPQTMSKMSININAGDQCADVNYRGIRTLSNEEIVLQSKASLSDAIGLSFLSDTTKLSN